MNIIDIEDLISLQECSHEGCTHGVGRGGTEVEGKRGGSSSQLQRVMVATRCEVCEGGFCDEWGRG